MDPLTTTFITIPLPDRAAFDRLSTALADADINIEGFTTEDDHVAFYTPDVARTIEIVAAAGFRAETFPALTLDLPNLPGVFARVGRAFRAGGVNIRSSFGVGTGPVGRVFLQVDAYDRALPIANEIARRVNIAPPPAPHAPAAAKATRVDEPDAQMNPDPQNPPQHPNGPHDNAAAVPQDAQPAEGHAPVATPLPTTRLN